MKQKVVWVGSVLLTAALAGAACGGGDDSGTPTSPTPPSGGGTTTITITASGSRVTFVNNDGRRHDMSSDPHPEHTECGEINQVGVLQPGESRQTGNLNTVRTCGFHDHDQPNVSSLRGSIRIQ
jgi:hypothetical protein